MYQNKDVFLEMLGDKIYAHQIIDNWKKEKEVTTKRNILPNIVYLHEDGWKASIQLRTLFAMVTQAKTNKK